VNSVTYNIFIYWNVSLYNAVRCRVSERTFVRNAGRDQLSSTVHYASWFAAGSKLVTDRFEAKFHYTIWFAAGSKLIADRFETGRRPASNLSAISFEPASNQLAWWNLALIMLALCNRADHYILPCGFYLSSFFLLFSSPNLSGRRLDVYHTSTHGVALVRI